MRSPLPALLLCGLLISLPGPLFANPSPLSQQCLACHETELQIHYGAIQDPSHWNAGVSCYECHQAQPERPEAVEHYGAILTNDPEQGCQRCHRK